MGSKSISSLTILVSVVGLVVVDNFRNLDSGIGCVVYKKCHLLFFPFAFAFLTLAVPTSGGGMTGK